MKRIHVSLIALSVFLMAPGCVPGQLQTAPPQGASAPPRGTTEGAGSTIFGNYCESCHGKVEAAPTPAMLKKMTPEHIYMALSTGDMVQMAKDLTDQQKRDIAEWVGGRKLGSTEIGDAKKMTNVCPNNPPIKDLTSAPAWNGWSPDLATTRYQPGKGRQFVRGQGDEAQIEMGFWIAGS